MYKFNAIMQQEEMVPCCEESRCVVPESHSLT